MNDFFFIPIKTTVADELTLKQSKIQSFEQIAHFGDGQMGNPNKNPGKPNNK
jgi:hypothetical protein